MDNSRYCNISACFASEYDESLPPNFYICMALDDTNFGGRLCPFYKTAKQLKKEYDELDISKKERHKIQRNKQSGGVVFKD